MSLNVAIEAADRERDYRTAEAHFDAAQLMALVDELPIGYRTVFNLYVLEGYNHREIGDLLNISEGASKSQLSRARAQLKRNILSMEEKIKKQNHEK